MIAISNPRPIMLITKPTATEIIIITISVKRIIPIYFPHPRFEILSVICSSQSLFFIRLGDITPGACLQAVGLFILVKNIDYSLINQKINDFITNISRDSYGIYLVNILVLNFLALTRSINAKGWSPLIAS